VTKGEGPCHSAPASLVALDLALGIVRRGRMMAVRLRPRRHGGRIDTTVTRGHDGAVAHVNPSVPRRAAAFGLRRGDRPRPNRAVKPDPGSLPA